MMRSLSLILSFSLTLAACQSAAPEVSPSPASSLADSAAPPPPPAGAFIGQLQPEQTQQLEALGIAVAIPTEVGPEFQVAKLVTQPATPDLAANYQILYRDNRDRCFVIEFTPEGIGGLPETEFQQPLDSPLFGPGYQLHYGPYTDPQLRSQFPAPEFATDWMLGESGAYRLAGAAYINQAFDSQTNCQDISPAEAQQLVASMTYLQSDLLNVAE
ncbi:hypothetical protein [Sphaerothrix gracilis]|uniref:hypothetical protein n=1 Tax=Sphaerothrix gracilis TaxID=3151835 RepID=UPI0031FE310B